MGFSHERSGLGMVLSVSINSAPSKGPDTTLVPWKLTRMVAGTQYPWDLTATSYNPPHWRRQIGLTASLRTFEHGSLEKCPNMLQKAPFERSSNPVSKLLMFCTGTPKRSSLLRRDSQLSSRLSGNSRGGHSKHLGIAPRSKSKVESSFCPNIVT